MSYPESFKKPISLEDAVSICLENSKPTDLAETISVSDAVGRVLAEDIIAKIDVPPFARAAMDGFAVRSADVRCASEKNPISLKIKSRILAGEASTVSISKGECVAIATGGMLPKGADAVAMVEITRYDSSHPENVQILEPIAKGEHVILPGSDIAKGKYVAREGEYLLPARIGAISSVGREKCKVYRKPRVVVMPTGNEVVRPGKRLKPGQVYDVNTFTLFSAASSFGADARIADIVADDHKSISKAVRSNADADIIVLSGGSSVGEKDLLASVIEKMGKILFHGVAIKPGKPTLLGKVGRCLVLGMPGHPTSCLSNAYLFLGPMIRKIGRINIPFAKEMSLILARDVRIPKDRKLVLPVRVQGAFAIPTFKESSAITSMSSADGFTVLSANGASLARKGSIVSVRLY
ncbi:MAG: molybdopterin molybdotransferase MoeA [Thermoplasmata archaeon]